jgi:hypothetical protein
VIDEMRPEYDFSGGERGKYSPPLDQVRDYLRVLAGFAADKVSREVYAFTGPADLLLQRGRSFAVQPMPAEWAGKVVSLEKQCFDNAYRLAVKSRGRLRYVEGYAAGIIPVEHAWCIDANDRVVDPTWSDGVVYFGIEVPLPAVRAARRRDCTTALFDWVKRYPLCLKGAEL